MAEGIRYARLFSNGQSQAVRLPKEFRFEGNRVRVRRIGDGVLLQPEILDVRSFFEAIDACGASDFMREGRKQPPMPKNDITFD